MADRKVLMDGAMSALGLATAAALVFIAPTLATSDAAQSHDGAVETSGAWTDLDRGPDVVSTTDRPLTTQATRTKADQ